MADLDAVVALTRSNLARFRRRAVEPAPQTRRAVVAVTLLPHRGEAHVLLLKRVARGRNGGQWALPGGRLDGAETVVEAALRELAEETGLLARPGDVIGRLDDFVTDSGFHITPVVVAPEPAARPVRNPAEVHSLHPIPVERLLALELPRWRRQPDGTRLLQLPLRRGMVVHAPTGALLWQFREVALLGRATRVADAVQPAFTRD